MKFRIFVQDVGRSGYSGFKEVEAVSTKAAVKGLKVPSWRSEFSTSKLPYYIALPNNRKDLWPDGQTGQVPKEALTCQ